MQTTFGAYTSAPSPVSGMPPQQYALVWSENFGSPVIFDDAANSRWTYYLKGWNVHWLAGNSAKQYYAKDDLVMIGTAQTAAQILQEDGRWGVKTNYLHECSNGTLKMRAYPLAAGDYSKFAGQEFAAGAIAAEMQAGQTYGYIEVRARVNAMGNGQHLSFWMLADDNSYPPEVDMMEVVQITSTGQRFWTCNLHGSVNPLTYYTQNDPSGWHVYSVEWTPAWVRWRVDGQMKREEAVSSGLSTKPLHFLMDWEIGGSWSGSPDETTPWPAEVEVDYIRQYKDPNVAYYITDSERSIVAAIETVTPQEMSANATISTRAVHFIGSTTSAKLPETTIPTTIDAYNYNSADVVLSGNVPGYPGGYYLEPNGFVKLSKRSNTDWRVFETIPPQIQNITTDATTITSPMCIVGGSASTVNLPSGTKRALVRTKVKNTLGGNITIQASPRDWNVRGVTVPLQSTAYAVVRTPLGVSNSQKFVLSVCAKPSSTATTDTTVLATGIGSMSDYIAVWISTSNTQLAVSIKTAGTAHTAVKFAITADVAQHWLISVDLSVPRVQLCINGVLQSPVSTTLPGNTTTQVPWGAATNIGVLGYYGGSARTFCGAMAQLWLLAGTSYDLTNGTNIAKFFANGEPKDLGDTGNGPTGTTPTVYLNKAGNPFFTVPSDGGTPFVIDSHIVPTIPPAGTFPIAASITGNPSGYTLGAGQTVELYQSSLGVWDIL